MRPSFRAVRGAIAVAAVVAIGALAASCASTQTSLCDPLTIEQSGRCFWSKQEACDAASCLPPAQCELLEGKPAHVKCVQPSS